MKVTMITHDRKIDRRIIHEAESLVKSGYDVSIVAFPFEGPNYTDIPIVRVEAQAAHQNSYLFSGILSVYSKTRGFLLARPKLFWFIRKIFNGYFLDMESYFENVLLDLAIEERADIYHVHDLPSLSTGVKAANKNQSKLVYDSHEYYIEQGFGVREKKKWAAIEAKYISKVNSVITVNESIKNELEKLYDIKNVSVIMNKIDTHDLEDNDLLRRTVGLSSNDVIILFQGGIVPGRNIEMLVESFKDLKELNVHLILMGPGNYKEKLIKICNRFDIHNVHFIDEVPQNKLLEYTQSADFGIIPYTANCLNGLYCTPNKLFEFIMAELPIISNDLPELRKIVHDNGIGIVSKFDNPNGISSAIKKAITNNEYNMYKEALVNLKYEFSWENEERILLDIYNRL